MLRLWRIIQHWSQGDRRCHTDEKMDSLKRSGAQAVLSSRPGCMLYLADDIRRKRMSLEVMHISRLTKSDVMENIS
jgi:hypothetical protein